MDTVPKGFLTRALTYCSEKLVFPLVLLMFGVVLKDTYDAHQKTARDSKQREELADAKRKEGANLEIEIKRRLRIFCVKFQEAG